jgi:hypothetical protein
MFMNRQSSIIVLGLATALIQGGACTSQSRREPSHRERDDPQVAIHLNLTDSVLAVAHWKNAHNVCAAAADGSIFIFDSRLERRRPWELLLPSQGLRALRVCSAVDSVLTLSFDGHVTLIPVNVPAGERDCWQCGDVASAIGVDKEGRRALIGQADGRWHLLDFARRDVITSGTGRACAISAAALSADATIGALGYSDGIAEVFNAATGTCRAMESMEPEHPIAAMAITADGRLACAITANGKILCWDIVTEKRLWLLDTKAPTQFPALMPGIVDGKCVIFVGAKGCVWCLDCANGGVSDVYQLPYDDSVTALMDNAANNTLVAGTFMGSLVVWHTADGTIERQVVLKTR